MQPVAFFTFLLDFSGVYETENFRPAGTVRLDLTDLDGIECYCDPQSADRIRRRIAALSGDSLQTRQTPGIHWLDGGDYHYASLFWLERIARPFVLVLIDNHSDDQPGAFGGDLLSCGGWVAEARETLPMLKETVWIRDAGQETVLPDLPVYLSIDKDVLSRDFARTNWDQGEMTLPQLKGIIEGIAADHEILGIDICGELSSSKGATAGDYAINLSTNLELQDFFVSLQTQ